jgi:hypothetical protein
MRARDIPADGGRHRAAILTTKGEGLWGEGDVVGQGAELRGVVEVTVAQVVAVPYTIEFEVGDEAEVGWRGYRETQEGDGLAEMECLIWVENGYEFGVSG